MVHFSPSSRTAPDEPENEVGESSRGSPCAKGGNHRFSRPKGAGMMARAAAAAGNVIRYSRMSSNFSHSSAATTQRGRTSRTSEATPDDEDDAGDNSRMSSRLSRIVRESSIVQGVRRKTVMITDKATDSLGATFVSTRRRFGGAVTENAPKLSTLRPPSQLRVVNGTVAGTIVPALLQLHPALAIPLGGLMYCTFIFVFGFIYMASGDCFEFAEAHEAGAFRFPQGLWISINVASSMGAMAMDPECMGAQMAVLAESFLTVLYTAALGGYVVSILLRPRSRLHFSTKFLLCPDQASASAPALPRSNPPAAALCS